jgi:hypothetical protein
MGSVAGGVGGDGPATVRGERLSRGTAAAMLGARGRRRSSRRPLLDLKEARREANPRKSWPEQGLHGEVPTAHGSGLLRCLSTQGEGARANERERAALDWEPNRTRQLQFDVLVEGEKNHALNQRSSATASV